jgi:electron transfer flavoprotein alpha subunit
LPNILVYADVRAGTPTAPTLYALSEARRVARGAGASVFALVASPPLGNQSLTALSIPLAAAGADKLLLCEAEEFADPPDDATCGRALDAAVARIPPLLALFPAGGTGAVLGPPLAARLGAPFVPWCDFTVSEADGKSLRGNSRVQVMRLRRDGRSRRRLDPAHIERPIVVTLGAGRCPPPTGSERNLEIEVLPLPPLRAPRQAARVLSRTPNPQAALLLAAVLVIVGDDTPDAAAIVSTFADRRERAPDASRPIALVMASHAPRSMLAACCPEIVVRVGASSATTARSPRTRVILASPQSDRRGPGASEAPTATGEDVDVLWSFSSPGELVDMVFQLGGQA